jgi:hypothetical protein
MTVHLISVGTSILTDALRKPREKLGAGSDLARVIGKERPADLLADQRILAHQRDDASEWLAGALAPNGSPARDEAKADRLAKVMAAITPDLWPDSFSAEIQTLARMPYARRPFPETDIGILICSDTPDGLLAGVWNAVALTHGNLDRVSYLPDLSDSVSAEGTRARMARKELLGSARGQVVIARVSGMDAADNRRFKGAMEALGVLASDLFQYGKLDRGEPFRFCLSGGYKAAIPYLIGLAEAVRSVDESRLTQLGVPELMPAGGAPYPAEAYMLHETSPDPIPLPLRYLIADEVRIELQDFGIQDRIQREKRIPGGWGRLEGYAYEATSPGGKGAWELTPFGAGLRKFLGVPAEGIGG